jgi:hypothetical protein
MSRKLKRAVDSPEVMKEVAAGWLPILQAGDVTDSSGKKHSFTRDFLDEVVSNYDADTEEAPLVIGHPKTDDPAYGWVKALKRVGDFLLAQPHKVAEEFKKAVNAGKWNKRSVKLSGSRLIHVGFLGAALPAVSGLGSAQLSGDEDGLVYEFGMSIDPNDPDWTLAWKIVDIGNGFGRLRDMIIEDKGLEYADKFFPRYLIENLTERPQPQPPARDNSFSQGDDDMNLQEALAKITELEGRITTLSGQLTTKDTELTAAKGRVTALETDIANRDKAAWEAHRDEFCAGLQKKGILLAADLPNARTILDRARAAGSGEFAAGKNPELDASKLLLSSGKPKLSAREIATLNAAAEDSGAAKPTDEAAAIAREAAEFQSSEERAGRQVDIVTAVRTVRQRRQAAR